eukprot:10094008-Alexandrium_andersonii.AAC.1
MHAGGKRVCVLLGVRVGVRELLEKPPSRQSLPQAGLHGECQGRTLFACRVRPAETHPLPSIKSLCWACRL